MRFDHYKGLNQAGLRLLKRRVRVQEYVKRVFPDGRVETFERKSIPAVARVTRIGSIKGAYKSRVAHLRRYYMLDGVTYFDEFVQQEIWAGGPHYFIALKDNLGNAVTRTLWTDQQMNTAISDE